MSKPKRLTYLGVPYLVTTLKVKGSSKRVVIRRALDERGTSDVNVCSGDARKHGFKCFLKRPLTVEEMDMSDVEVFEIVKNS